MPRLAWLAVQPAAAWLLMAAAAAQAQTSTQPPSGRYYVQTVVTSIAPAKEGGSCGATLPGYATAGASSFAISFVYSQTIRTTTTTFIDVRGGVLIAPSNTATPSYIHDEKYAFDQNSTFADQSGEVGVLINGTLEERFPYSSQVTILNNVGFVANVSIDVRQGAGEPDCVEKLQELFTLIAAS